MKKIFSFIFLLTIGITNIFSQCNLPAAAGTITAGFSNVVCQTQTGAPFAVVAITNATGYSWVYSGVGATISTDTSNFITIDFSSTATSGILTVAGTNACGIGSVSPNYTITVIPLPAAAGIIIGTPVVCQSATGISYSTSSIANANNYTWQYSGIGANINGSMDSITIDFSSTATSGILTVMGSNDCTNGIASADFPITVNPVPQGSFIGNSICTSDARNGQLTWIESSGAGPYTVIYNDGIANRSQTNVSSGVAFDSFTKPASTNTYTLVSVTSNNCSRTSDFNNAIATITVESQGVLINSNPSDTSVCAGSNALFSISASGVYAYQWQVSTDGGVNYSNIVAAGTNPTYFNFATASLGLSGTSMANNGYKYQCLITASCGADVTSTSATLTVNPLPAAADSIIGTARVCQGQNGVIYTVPAIANAVNYVWSYFSPNITNPGVTLTASSNTVIINFSSFATSGYLTVMGTTPFCNGIVSATFPISVILLPISAGLITGTHVVCQNQTGVFYSVPIIHDHSSNDYPTFTWAYTGSGISISGPTDPMTIDFSDSATSGILTVMRTQACGNGQISPNYNITVNAAPAAPSIITDTTFVCQGVRQLTYSITAIPNATKYIWAYSGNGTTITDSTNSIIINFSSTATSGNLTVQGINTHCNGPVSNNYPINLNTCIGIKENNILQDVNLFPNPTYGIFNIEIKNANFNNLMISVFDILGKEVYEASTLKGVNSTAPINRGGGQIININLEGLAKGIYYVKLATDVDMKTFKISIQ
jgi:hypothetical protein